MKKVYHLGTCSTCIRIIKDLQLESKGFEFQDIKTTSITPEQIDAMKEKAGSYEALFSKRAMKYRSMGLNEMELGEDDFRKYILEEYTFLKRPVIVVGDQQFVGNAKSTVEALRDVIA